ncbi:hypothetical protein Bca52824_035525 [Brassica carinata]|uniref:Uncharacterized protein n=1 Tax=Brassica carinata TaxID=52824 RepID=A0A8X7S3D2_BRACI|nr:hypothetical protein Bca52824_035525 [Brassica carinata]
MNDASSVPGDHRGWEEGDLRKKIVVEAMVELKLTVDDTRTIIPSDLGCKKITMHLILRLVVARRPFLYVFFFLGGEKCEESRELIGVERVFFHEKVNDLTLIDLGKLEECLIRMK